MTSPQIKICGLTTQDVVRACVHSKANFIGFVLYDKSPRHISAIDYAQLAKEAGDISTVLVTVDASDVLLDEYFDLHIPDYVQCHGDESSQRLAEIRSRNVKIIKTIKISEDSDLVKIAEFREYADILLLDAKPVIGELPGGNAKSFDWSLLKNINIKGDWMLSGGLDSANIASAILQTGAPMVDVSSGVEANPGLKSIDKIKEFIANV